ncbi:MAG: HD domain-containing protein [Betaproteobacteria bacterium]|jgi:predicted HD phosphohydrolase|nr:hypothetical protein AEM42_00160 [Betaproteobacteria bacterium UKL13-2]HCG54285.1 phosphohydrolase [Betaproteobacteria bacterium]
MDKDKFLEKITQLFTRHGAVHYGPEPVTLMHHSMQCAQLAQAAGADDALIVAAGLHDIGHMVVLAEGRRYTDGGDNHEHIGAEFLSPFLTSAVVETVRLHVEAKRYLVANDAAYEALLSQGSIDSLKRQGGPMTEAESQTFRSSSAFSSAVALRRIDEAAKTVGAPGMPLTAFLAYVERVAVA